MTDRILDGHTLHEAAFRVAQLERLGEETQEELLPFVRFATRYHRNTRGERMTFEDRSYLMEVYSTHNVPEFCCMKAVQMGISEFFIVAIFQKAAECGWTVMYVMPNQPMRNTFVQNRIDRPIDYSDAYQSLIERSVGRTHRIGLKHFGRGTLLFVGSNSITEFKETPADMRVVDEIDQCDLQNLPFADDRLQASPYKYKWAAGNPTTGGRGIADLYYHHSDQREWQIQCRRCGEWQPLDWFENVVVNVGSEREPEYQLRDQRWTPRSKRDIHVLCRYCGAPLHRLSQGRWKPKFPKRRMRGYHFSHLFSPTVSIQEMWDYFQEALLNETKMQVFYNSKLGLPYTSMGNRVTADLLDSLKGDYAQWPNAAREYKVVMGVDVGAWLHVVLSALVGGEERVIHIGKYRSFRQLEDLMLLYEVQRAVIDIRPETRKAKEFRDAWGHRVYLCEYASSPSGRTLQPPKIDQAERTIVVDRTQSLDDAVNVLLTRQVQLPADADLVDNGAFYKQMTCSSRVYYEKGDYFQWVEDGLDHYFHAWNYCHLARRMLPAQRSFYIGPEAPEVKKEKQPGAAKEKLKPIAQSMPPEAQGLSAKRLKGTCANCVSYPEHCPEEAYCATIGMRTRASNPACMLAYRPRTGVARKKKKPDAQAG